MNLFELQTRANALVAKVNAYEDTIEGMTLDENAIIDQHLYADIFCLRTVMHRLFATTPADRASTSLSTTDVDWSLVTQTAVGRNEIWKLNDNTYRGQASTSEYTNDITTNNDMMSHYNMIVGEPAFPYAKYLLNSTSAQIKSQLVSGNCFNVYGAHISDALITESQTSNIFRWNTTPEDDITNVSANSNIPQQVPGIVTYYLGSGYDGEYSATIPYNTNKSSVAVNYNTPAIYGAFYKDANGPEDVVSQQPKNRGAEGLRMFMPGTTFFNGGAISPIDIYQPFPRYDTPTGYNYQGKALYHELTFKRRRAGSSAANVDFLPFKQFEAGANDNDPQGLAMRLALAQQKPYYYNRPWFTELDELYTTEGTKQAALADKIIEDSKNIIYKPDYTKVEKVGDVTLNEDTGIATSSSFDKNNYIAIPNTVQGAVNSLELVMKCSGTYTSYGWSSIMTKSLSDKDTVSGLALYGVMGTSDGLIGNRVRLSFEKQGGTTRQNVTFDNLDSGTTGGKYYRYFKIHYDGTNWTAQVTTDDGVTWSDPISPTSSSQEKPYLNQDKFYFFDTYTSTAIKLTEIDFSVFKLNINGTDILPHNIEAGQSNMTDSEFYNNYQLSYDTYAEALGEPQ